MLVVLCLAFGTVFGELLGIKPVETTPDNLFTLDGLPEGIDPESPGVNNGYYPQQRNILGGITITL